MGSTPRSGRSPGVGNGNPSSILAWKIPWTEEPGGLQPMESQRVRRAHTHQAKADIQRTSSYFPPEIQFPMPWLDLTGNEETMVFLSSFLTLQLKKKRRKECYILAKYIELPQDFLSCSISFFQTVLNCIFQGRFLFVCFLNLCIQEC